MTLAENPGDAHECVPGCREGVSCDLRGLGTWFNLCCSPLTTPGSPGDLSSLANLDPIL